MQTHHAGGRPNAPLTPKSMRIIAFALMGGVVMFGVVTAIVTQSDSFLEPTPASTDPGVADPAGSDADDPLAIIRWIGLAMLFMMIAVAVPLRTKRLKVAIETEDEDAAGHIYSAASLVFFAMLEGAALFNIVGWLVTKNPVPGLVAAGVAVLLMAVSLPSEDHLRRLRELRGLRN